MSIIDNVEQYMKRYDHLIEKQTRRHNKGNTLSKEEEEELQKLRPTVLTPLSMMFEILFDTVKTNQDIRLNNKSRGTVQHGGRSMQEMENEMSEAKGLETAAAPAPAAAASAVTAAAVAAASAAAAAVVIAKQPTEPEPEPESDKPAEKSEGDKPAAAEEDDEDADAKEARRLSELEESLLPLLTKIIVYIEQNKKAEKKKEDEPEEEKYPDIGTTAKNSAILVIRKIKKWWNDLIQGGSSDLSSKINLKKAIPQLPDNPDDLNKMVDKASAAVHEPLQKIEKLLSNDVKDIASSSVEGIMNALSLIPGIGTTLQLWRLLQNVIVIMSKSVTTMAGAKTQGVALKTNIMDLKGDMEAMVAEKAKGAAMGGLAGALPGVGGLAGMPAMPAGMPAGMPSLSSLGGAGAGAAVAKMMGGGSTSTKPHKQNRLRSIKKYKQEYKQSLREIRKTKKRIMKYFHNII